MGCKKEVLVKDKLSKKLLSTFIVALMLMASFFIQSAGNTAWSETLV